MHGLDSTGRALCVGQLLCWPSSNDCIEAIMLPRPCLLPLPSLCSNSFAYGVLHSTPCLGPGGLALTDLVEIADTCVKNSSLQASMLVPVTSRFAYIRG